MKDYSFDWILFGAGLVVVVPVWVNVFLQKQALRRQRSHARNQ